MIGRIGFFGIIFVAVSTAQEINLLKATANNADHPIQFNFDTHRYKDGLYLDGNVTVTEDVPEIRISITETRCSPDFSECEFVNNKTTPVICQLLQKQDLPWGPFINHLHYTGQCPIPEGTYWLNDYFIDSKLAPDKEHSWIVCYTVLSKGETFGQLCLTYGPPEQYENVQENNN